MSDDLKLRSGETLFRLPRGEERPEEVYTLEEVRAKPRALVDWNNDLFRVNDLHAAGFTGKGVKVGVADTGAQKNHPAYAPRLVAYKDFTGSSVGPEDVNGHGTHVCGIVGASRDAVTGVGAAPDCELYMAKVLGDSGSGGSFGIAAGIDWLVEQGCHIISLSLGSSSPDATINGAIKRAREKGVLVIAAAGNDGPGMGTVGWPGAYELCQAVAAVDRNGNIAGFSSRGPEVDIAGYGVQVVSSLPGSRAGRMSGTSMATPAVAGLAACVIQMQKDRGQPADPDTVIGLMQRAVVKKEPATSFGKGIFVPALLLADAPPPSPPVTPPPPPASPKRFTFAGQQSGFFGGPITGIMTEVVGQPATAAAVNPGDLLELIRLAKLLFDLWRRFKGGQAAEVVPLALIDDIERWLPVVLTYVGKLAPVILAGVREGKPVWQIVLDCVAALRSAGVSP